MGDRQYFLLLAFELDLEDHLLTIEYACSLYLGDVLGEEARRFLETVITDDLEFLTADATHFFSPYQDGRLVLGKHNSVPWVHLDNPRADPYRNTLPCAERLGVSIGEISPVGR